MQRFHFPARRYEPKCELTQRNSTRWGYCEFQQFPFVVSQCPAASKPIADATELKAIPVICPESAVKRGVQYGPQLFRQYDPLIEPNYSQAPGKSP